MSTRSYATSQVINVGAPAAVILSDEGNQIGTIINSLNFVGDGIFATTTNGVVTVEVILPTQYDGGNF